MLGTTGGVVELEAGGLGRGRGSGWLADDPKVGGGCRVRWLAGRGDRGRSGEGIPRKSIWWSGGGDETNLLEFRVCLIWLGAAL